SGDTVLLVNTTLEGTPDRVRPDGRSSGFIAEYDIANKRWQAVIPMSDPENVPGAKAVTRVEWLPARQQLKLSLSALKDGQKKAEFFAKDQGVWGVRAGAAAAAVTDNGARLKVALRQSENEAPVMFASDGSAEVQLTPPDEALAGIWLSPAR